MANDLRDIPPEGFYEILDATLTELLEKSYADITPEVDIVLLRFDLTLRQALGLPRRGN
jgi:hypothetical protein